MADRIKNYQQEADQITTLKAIRTDLGVTPSSYTPDATVVTKDRVVTFAQAEEELAVLGDIEKGVKQQIVDVDIAQKDISNIKTLLQGNLYDYQTDSTSAYTKSVPSGAMPYAGLEKVGGKTVVWNQLCDFGTITGDGSSVYLAFHQGVSIVSGHKYYTKADFTSQGTPHVDIYTSVGGVSTVVLSVNSPQIFTSAYNATSNGTTSGNAGNMWVFIQSSSGFASGDTMENFMLIDLTLMFGSGNEPSTVSEFETMFPASYYAYNEGTLLSAGVTEVESVGKNVCDFQTYSSSFQGVTCNTSGGSTVSLSGTNSSPDSQVWFTLTLKTFPKETITIKINDVPTNLYSCYVSAGNVSGTENYIGALLTNGFVQSVRTFDPSPYKLVTITLGVKANSTINGAVTFQVEKGSTATAYTPYHAPIHYPIPTAIRNLEGYGMGTSQASNYIDFEAKKFVKCVKKMVLNGTEDGWNSNSSGASRYFAIAVGDVYDKNILTTDIPIVSILYANDVVGIDLNSGNIYFRPNNNGWSVDQFKTWLASNNITVYIGLQSPDDEVDISAYLTDDNLIQVESGGTLTFENQNGTDYQIPVPSEETYMIDLQSALGE